MTVRAAPRRRRLPVALFIAMACAWAAAIAAHGTGVAHRFHHDRLVGPHGSPDVVGLAGFAALWTVMVAAMMLPSATPLLRLFVETSVRQPRPGWIVGCFVAGYVAVWAAFGWLALAFDAGVHRGVDAWPWLDARPWLVGAAALAIAGAFQFSGLKDRCLTLCRHPAAYLLRHYRRGAGAAFRLGGGHGLFCLGCCWALMLVMFAVGIADLVWMAALAALMAYEKIGRHGRRVAAVAGAVALGLAVLVALLPDALPLIPTEHE